MALEVLRIHVVLNEGYKSTERAMAYYCSLKWKGEKWRFRNSCIKKEWQNEKSSYVYKSIVILYLDQSIYWLWVRMHNNGEHRISYLWTWYRVLCSFFFFTETVQQIIYTYCALGIILNVNNMTCKWKKCIGR